MQFVSSSSSDNLEFGNIRKNKKRKKKKRKGAIIVVRTEIVTDKKYLYRKQRRIIDSQTDRQTASHRDNQRSVRMTEMS